MKLFIFLKFQQLIPKKERMLLPIWFRIMLIEQIFLFISNYNFMINYTTNK